MFHVENRNDSVSVIVAGELDEENNSRFDELLTAVATDDLASFTLDLRQCTYINSTGISSIVRMSRKFPGDFEVLVLGTGAVHRVLDVCGFLYPDGFVTVESNEPDAGSIAV